MRKRSSDGAGTLRPAASPVKQKVSAETSPHQPASAEPVPDPPDDEATSLQLDLEHQVGVTASALYLLRALFQSGPLDEVMLQNPLAKHHIGELCSHLFTGLNTALEEVQCHRTSILLQEQKGGK